MRVARIDESAPEAQPNLAELETHRDLPSGLAQKMKDSVAVAPPPPAAPKPAVPPPAAPKPAVPPPPPPAKAAAPPPAPKAAPPPPTAKPSTQPIIELLRSATGKMERVTIADKEVVALGRDPAVDVVIDADAAVVSRRHAEIKRRDGQCVLFDLGSFNGTLINDQRITAPTPLYDGDRIQLGMGGPILRFSDPAHPAQSQGQMPAAARAVSGAVPVVSTERAQSGDVGMHTMVIKAGSGSLKPVYAAPHGRRAAAAASDAAHF